MRPRQTFGRWFLVVGLMSAAALVSSAQGTPQDRNPRVVTALGPESFVSRVVADNLAGPWEVSWGPDAFLWITERVGKRVTRVDPTDGSRTVAVTIDEVHQTLNQDGLLGLALHPDLLKGKGMDYVYVAYTYDADPESSVDLRMKVRRYTYEPLVQRLSSPVDILTGLPHGTDHGGGRIVFGPDGKLYLSRGDHGSNFLANYCDPNHAQDLPTAEQVQAADWSMYQGKILRVNVDGSIPRDNPTINGVRSHIYSYGHRNPQGLAFADKRLFDSEHGESIDDEVNLVTPGGELWVATHRRLSGRPVVRLRELVGVVTAALPLADVQRVESAGICAPAAGVRGARAEFRATGEDVFHRAERL